jgi:uncharacterized protein
MSPTAWLVIVLAGAALLVPPAAAEPSWCRYARSETEQTICATPRLWELDTCEDGVFKAARDGAPAGQRRALELQERTWTRERDRCGSDISCIRHRYRERATAIDPVAGAACGIQEAAKVAPESAAAAPSWCRYARSDTERTICATPQLWQLDRCEDDLFKAALNSGTARQRRALDLQERAWTRERDLCGSDVLCIHPRYRERASAIDPVSSGVCGMRDAAKSASEPAAPPVRPTAVRPPLDQALCGGRAQNRMGARGR